MVLIPFGGCNMNPFICSLHKFLGSYHIFIFIRTLTFQLHTLPIFDSSFFPQNAKFSFRDLIDQWVRHLEVRAELLSIALRAELPLSEKIELIIRALIPANLHWTPKYLKKLKTQLKILKGRWWQ